MFIFIDSTWRAFEFKELMWNSSTGEWRILKYLESILMMMSTRGILNKYLHDVGKAPSMFFPTNTAYSMVLGTGSLRESHHFNETWPLGWCQNTLISLSGPVKCLPISIFLQSSYQGQGFFPFFCTINWKFSKGMPFFPKMSIIPW